MTLRTTSLLLALVFSAGALASQAGNPVAGKKLFESTKDSKGNAKPACLSCHGAGANQPLEGMPKLAGQYPDYLTKALKEYRSGKRSNAIMGGQAKDLSDADIANITAYFESLDGDIHDLSGHAR
jgi:cytochrome c553